jgi:hypothetical protein
MSGMKEACVPGGLAGSTGADAGVNAAAGLIAAATDGDTGTIGVVLFVVGVAGGARHIYINTYIQPKKI